MRDRAFRWVAVHGSLVLAYITPWLRGVPGAPDLPDDHSPVIGTDLNGIAPPDRQLFDNGRGDSDHQRVALGDHAAMDLFSPDDLVHNIPHSFFLGRYPR